jgi:hypothetical protein
MSSPSPHLRAAGVSILAVLVHPAPGLVVPLLPRLLELRSETWWQVSLFAVQVACGLLAQLAAAAGAEAEGGGGGGGGGAQWAPAVADALSILQDTLAGARGPPSPMVLQAFVAHGARLAGHYEAVRALLLGALLALPPAAREAALLVTPSGEFLPPGEEALPLLGPSGQTLAVASVGDALPAAAMLDAVAAHVGGESLSYLEMGHFQVLLAAARSALSAEVAAAPAPAPGAPAPAVQLPPEFAALARPAPGLRDYVMVGLCDPGCGSAALALLRLLILFLPSGSGGGLDLLAANTMLGSVYLLHCPNTGEPSAEQKAATTAFLREIAGTSEEHARAVRAFLVEWAGRYPQAMPDSPLRGLLEALS